MKINHNLSAVITNTELRKNENSVAASMEKLSSGISINHSKDNPVGMAISNMMKTQIKGLDRATENSQTFLSLLNTAEGAISEMHSVAQRMREIAVQAANDTNTDMDREALENEMKSLQKEIDRISKDTEFNGKRLLDGTMDVPVYSKEISNVQVGGTQRAGEYEISYTPETGMSYISQSSGDSTPITTSGTYSITMTTTDKGSFSWNRNIADGQEITQEEVINEVSRIAEQSGIYFAYNDATILSLKTDGEWSYRIGENAPPGTFPVSIEASPEIAKMLGYWNSDGSTLPHTLNSAAGITPGSGFSSCEVKMDGNRFEIQDLDYGVTFTGTLNEGHSSATFLVPDVELPQAQVGSGEGQLLRVQIPRIDTDTLDLKELSLRSFESAGDAIDRIDKAIQTISDHRAHIGALTNRFEYTIAYLEDNSENMNAAVSTISDTDMAEEMTEYTSQNVLVQAATSMLAQANDAPEQLLSLLQ